MSNPSIKVNHSIDEMGLRAIERRLDNMLGMMDDVTYDTVGELLKDETFSCQVQFRRALRQSNLAVTETTESYMFNNEFEGRRSVYTFTMEKKPFRIYITAIPKREEDNEGLWLTDFYVDLEQEQRWNYNARISGELDDREDRMKTAIDMAIGEARKKFTFVRTVNPDDRCPAYPYVGYLYEGADNTSKRYSVYYGGSQPYKLYDGSRYLDGFDGNLAVNTVFQSRNEHFNVQSENLFGKLFRLTNDYMFLTFIL